MKIKKVLDWPEYDSNTTPEEINKNLRAENMLLRLALSEVFYFLSQDDGKTLMERIDAMYDAIERIRREGN